MLRGLLRLLNKPVEQNHLAVVYTEEDSRNPITSQRRAHFIETVAHQSASAYQTVGCSYLS